MITSSNTATLSSSTTYAYGNSASNSTSKIVSSTTVSATSSSTTAQVSSSSTTPEINISENYNYYTSLIEGIDNQIRALAYDSTLKYTDSEGAKEKLAELQAMRQQIYQEVSMRNRITPGVSENIEYEAFSFTREEEKAFDLMVQENIMEFISQDKYSNDAWFDYTREEKEMCLMEVFDYVSERLGVNVDGIAFDETTSANGCYDRDSNTIIIKEGCLGEWANNGVIKTLIHEMRHAYQWAATENPDLYVVSDETRTVWAENLRIENYIKASEENKYAYRAQPVEWDAANFAMQGKNINDAKKATIIYEGSWEIE